MNKPYDAAKGHGIKNIYEFLMFVDKNPGVIKDYDFIESYRPILERYEIQDFPVERQHLFPILLECYEVLDSC